MPFSVCMCMSVGRFPDTNLSSLTVYLFLYLFFIATKNQSPGFFDNLKTSIINTVTVKVENIHLRYEDSITRPAHPYSAGIVLKSLNALTVGPEFEEGGSAPTNDTFFKLVKLNGLGTYWNSNTTKLLANKVKDDSIKTIDAISATIKQELIEDDGHGTNLHYFIGPVAATLKAMVTMKPNKLPKPYTLPTIDANLEIEQIKIGLTNLQFTDIAILGDSVENVIRAEPFKKFRPAAGHNKVKIKKGNSKPWWLFAYNAVWADIKRRKHWSWDKMKELKKLKEQYRNVSTFPCSSDSDIHSYSEKTLTYDRFSPVLFFVL